MERKA